MNNATIHLSHTFARCLIIIYNIPKWLWWFNCYFMLILLSQYQPLVFAPDILHSASDPTHLTTESLPVSERE
jgi:hypothetical protein